MAWYFLHGFAASPGITTYWGLSHLNHLYALFFSSCSFVKLYMSCKWRFGIVTNHYLHNDTIPSHSGFRCHQSCDFKCWWQFFFYRMAISSTIVISTGNKLCIKRNVLNVKWSYLDQGLRQYVHCLDIICNCMEDNSFSEYI